LARLTWPDRGTLRVSAVGAAHEACWETGKITIDEERIWLRVKVPAEDGTAVMVMTDPVVPENGLQASATVLAALEQRADGATKAAGRTVAALRERSWEGDDVLADQLEAWLGSGVIPDLRLFRSIWTSWPASSKATRYTAAGVSTWRPVRSRRRLPSTCAGDRPRIRTNQTILISGCGCTARVRGTATRT